MASPRRVRVAFFLDSFAIGGTELNAVRTAEALDPRRIELRVFHLQTHGPLRSRYERLGVPMTHVPISSLYSIRTARQGARVAGLLRSGQIDVAHSHDLYCNIFAVPWARLLGGCATIASRRWGRQASRMSLARVNRWSSMLADRILANSNGVAELLASEEHVPREKIVEIPNFLAESAFDTIDGEQRSANRRALGIPEGVFAVGIVARLSPVKNHAMLLQAVALLDARFHLVVIGDGPLRAELENMAVQLGIGPRVHFLGEMVSSRNLHESFDASVLCSFSEGFPNSLIEAMAAARPAVATPVGGVGDAVTHGATGIIVPVGDVASLADALRTLESDPQLRERLGQAGRDAVRLKFRQEVVIEKLSTLYEQLAMRRPLESSGIADG